MMIIIQQAGEIITDKTAFLSVEENIIAAVGWLKLGIEAVGAAVICIGALIAVYQFVTHFRDQQPSNFNRVRLTLGKYLTLALEFQVGADILSTAISPGWEQIGKLAAIAAIRTLLNYFLTKELTEEQKREEKTEPAAPTDVQV